MPTYNLSGIFIIGGSGVNGAIVTAWKASRFGSIPAKGAAAPAGSPDAGPLTTSASFGSDGAYQITVPTTEDYYIQVAYRSEVYWTLVHLLGDVTFGDIAGTATEGNDARLDTPVIFDNFRTKPDGPFVTGQIADDGGPWTVTGGSNAVLLGGAVQVDPAQGSPTSYYLMRDLGYKPTWFRMVGNFVFTGGRPANDAYGGAATMVNDASPDLSLATSTDKNQTVLHHEVQVLGPALETADNFSLQGLLSRYSGVPFTRAVTATLTSGSTAVTAVSGQTFKPYSAPVGVTGTGIPVGPPWLGTGTTLTYVDDTHATLSAPATASGVSLLSINDPIKTDGSREYHVELIADAESNLVTIYSANFENPVTIEVKKQVVPATVTSGSATVACTSVTTAMAGMPVSGPGIPANTYVGTTITGGVSFKLSSTIGSQTDVLATTNGTQVTLGNDLATYMNRYFIWEGTQGGLGLAGTVRWLDVAVYARDDNAVTGLWSRAARAVRELWARRGEFYQIHIGQIATRLGALPGLTFGTAEDTNLYRYNAGVVATDGVLQAASFSMGLTSVTTSRLLVDATDGGTILANGANLTLTLPPVFGAAKRDWRFVNLNTSPLTIQTSGSDTINGTMSSITIPAGASTTIFGNGINSWWWTETTTRSGLLFTGAGLIKGTDSLYPAAPPNGTICFTTDTSTSKQYISWRIGGAWFAVQGT